LPSLVLNRVERGRYLDSVAAMRLSRRLAALPGIEGAAMMIGTPANKDLLRAAGLLAAEGEGAQVNDLVIAVRAADEAAGRRALSGVFDLGEIQTASPGAFPHAKTLSGALERLPGANLALISVPGDFAAAEARRALGAGLHALVFSSGVALEEERALKLLAQEKGLLLMGPDCGTALIAGTPLAFANAVPRGDIGIVSASGTGLQEVSCLIARLGGGVSHGIGVGGRDLDERVGALGTLAAIDALERDPGTRTIVLISKPPAPRVAEQVLERLSRCAKRSVVCFLGLDKPGLAATLREAAEMATGCRIKDEATQSPAKRKGKVLGLYCGGTLCSEAEIIFRRLGLQGHRFVDLGDDRYTRGKPHPMIDPEIRNEHVARAVADPAVGVILVDVVLGYGSHPDPAGVLLKNQITKPLVASVIGTEQDPQVRSRQLAALREAGVLVAASNAHAAALAASLAG
jgi:FdrA protein